MFHGKYSYVKLSYKVLCKNQEFGYINKIGSKWISFFLTFGDTADVLAVVEENTCFISKYIYIYVYVRLLYQRKLSIISIANQLHEILDEITMLYFSCVHLLDICRNIFGIHCPCEIY